ncbi:MAG TPA: hypothetical protein VI488_06075 [Candidatus Angelobacter sp.]
MLSIRRKTHYRLWLLALLLTSAPCFAHVGSPDVYFDGNAGPYRLLVTVRPPPMIPGLAQIEVRSESPDIRGLKAVPLYIVGEGSKYPPAPDQLQRSKDDPQFFTGQLWFMGSGSLQVRLEAEGPQGSGTVAVPVPAFAMRTLAMQRTLGWFLFAVMSVLVVAFISIIGAGSREGFLDPGQKAGRTQSLRGVIVGGIAAALLIAILFLGNAWWNAEASSRALNTIYKPPALSVDVSPNGHLTLSIGESLWHSRRSRTVMTALIPDHGHLMHLFMIRVPQMDRFYHLHPWRTGETTFEEQLPAMPAGRYQIFADIVRASGFPDTMVAGVDIPDLPGAPTDAASDDSTALAPALPAALQSSDTAPLAGGGRMVWERDTTPIHAKRPIWFRFRVEDQAGKPVQDLEPYMGMAGHAEFVSFDRSVFAHVHPEGSVAMAALALANPSPEKPDAMAGMAHMSSEVSFPYGFPKPGDYRMFIQVKRAGQVQTGVFDVNVEP